MKNKILKTINCLAFFFGVLAGCALDSENWLPPLIVLIVCTAWGALFVWANSTVGREEEFEEEFEDE